MRVLLSSPGNSADPRAPTPQSPGARSSRSAPRMQPREGWGRAMQGSPRRPPARQPGAVLRIFTPRWGRGHRWQGPQAGRGPDQGRPLPLTHCPEPRDAGGTCCPDPPPPRAQADSGSAHGHRLGGGEPRLDREATGSHPGLGGAEVSARSDWTSWSLDGGRLRTQRASPQGPVGALPPPREPTTPAGGRTLAMPGPQAAPATPPVTPPAANGRSGLRVSPDPPHGHLLGSCPHPRPAGDLCPQ